MTPTAAGRWPVHRRGALVLAAAAVIAWLLLPTAPNYDTATHLLWARELLHGRSPEIDAAAAPTLHPLWLLVALPASASGVGASLLQLIAIGSLLVVGASAYRLAADLAGRIAGAVAAIATLSSFALLLLAFKAYVDLPFLALVLVAVVVERSWIPSALRPAATSDSSTTAWRAPDLTVPILLFFAGLLRPEAWALGILLLALRLLRGGTLRMLVIPALVVLAAPVLWMLTDLAFTGDPLHSLSGTRALAEELGRQTGLANAPKQLAVLLSDLARPPVAAAGLAGVALALWLVGWRPLLVTLAPLVAGVCGFIAVGALGLPLLQRYLLLPAVLVCVFAGVAAAVVIAAALGRPSPLVDERTGAADDRTPATAPTETEGRATDGLAGGAPRRGRGVPSPALRVVAAGALLVAVLGAGGYLVLKADSFRIVARGVLREARWQREAAQLVSEPAVVAKRCGPITLPTYRFVPELTLRAKLQPGSVVSRATALGGSGPQPRGIAIVIDGPHSALIRLGYAAGVPRTTNEIPPGFTEIARRGPFVATARCP